MTQAQPQPSVSPQGTDTYDNVDYTTWARPGGRFGIGIAQSYTTTNSNGYYTSITVTGYASMYRSWGYITIAPVYEIYNSNGDLITSVTASTYTFDEYEGSTRRRRNMGTTTISDLQLPGGTYTIKIINTNWFEYGTYDDNMQYVYHLKTITLADLITNCQPPTTITASGTIVPGGSFTVSWSGAQGGTANSINGYNIRYSADNGASWFDGGSSSATTASGSKTITASGTISRGATIICSVQTKGSAGSNFYSSWSNAGGSVKINRLPGTPDVTVSRTTVPSGGGSVTFTITGGDDPDGQSISYAYSTSPSGTKTAISSGGSVTVTAQTTFYFYAKDTLDEYGPATSGTTIYKNTKATCSISTSITGYTYTFNGSDNASGYKYAHTVNISSSSSKSSGVSGQILYRYSTTGAPTGSWSVWSNSLKQIGTSTVTWTPSIHDLLKNIYGNNTYYIQFMIEANDNNLDTVYSTASTVYAIAPYPSVTATRDNFNSSEDIYSGHCWDQIRIEYTEDTSVTSCEISGVAVSGNTSNTLTCNPKKITYSSASSTVTGVSGNTRYINVTISGTIPDNSAVTLTYTLSAKGLTKTIYSSTLIKLPTPTFSNESLILSNSQFIVYSAKDLDNTTPYIKFKTPITFTSGVINTNNDYKVNSFVIRVRKSNGTTRNVTPSNTPSVVAGNNITFTMGHNDLIQFTDFNTSLSYNGTRDGYVEVVFSNIYSKSFTLGNSFTVSYDVPPDFKTIELQYSTTNNVDDWHSLLSYKLQRDLYLRAVVTYDAWGDGTFPVILKRAIGTSGTYENIRSNDIVINEKNTTVHSNVTINIDYGKIGEITDDFQRHWKINFNGTDQDGNNIISTDVIKQTQPSWQFNDCTAINNTSVIPTFTFTNNNYGGADTSISELYIYYDATGYGDLNNNAFTVLDSGNTITINAPQDWVSLPLQLHFVSKIKGINDGGEGLISTIDTIKNYYSNIIFSYQSQPTVAYRNNYLGINTKAPNSNTILDIYGTNNKEVININDASGHYIQINLINHTIDIV